MDMHDNSCNPSQANKYREQAPGCCCLLQGSLDVACAIIDRYQLFLHNIQLLKAVWVLRICDVPNVLKDLCCIDSLTPINISGCSILQQIKQPSGISPDRCL